MFQDDVPGATPDPSGMPPAADPNAAPGGGNDDWQKDDEEEAGEATPETPTDPNAPSGM